jgi:hypothetical protein
MTARDLSPSHTVAPPGGDDGIAPEALERAMVETPKGALALAGLTVGLLMLAWLAVYFLIFIPRGMVG